MNAIIGDLVGLLTSAALLLTYHLYLYVKLRRMPLYTTQAVNRAARQAWVAHVMQDETRAILAVQTLRNSTMAATFLASTAMLLIMGTLSLTGQADALSSLWHSLSLFGPVPPAMWVAKVLLLASVWFVAFFCFAMSVRCFNHVGYRISLPRNLQSGPHGRASVIVLMNRAGRYYTFGMRAYFFAVPLVFWFFGPQFMLLATVIVIAIMILNDRVPRTGS